MDAEGEAPGGAVWTTADVAVALGLGSWAGLTTNKVQVNGGDAAGGGDL